MTYDKTNFKVTIKDWVRNVHAETPERAARLAACEYIRFSCLGELGMTLNVHLKSETFCDLIRVSTSVRARIVK